MKVLVFLSACLTMFTVNKACAQNFTLLFDTMETSTQGQTPPEGEDFANYCEVLHNYIINNEDSAITFQWQIYEKSLPFGWFIYGFCDNSTCWTQTSNIVANAAIANSSPINVGDSSEFKPMVAVPSDAEYGVGIIKAKVFTATHTDTAFFIINRTPTGLSIISQKDQRVVIYPNPTSDNVTIFADKNLNAKDVTVYNILGRKILTSSATGEITKLNISQLASGNYMIRITDNAGKVITSRSITKD